MKRLIAIILLVVSFSCKRDELKIEGAWYQVDPNVPDRHYWELHLTKSRFTVLNDVSFHSIGDYQISKTELTQLVRNKANQATVVDTISFHYILDNNTLRLIDPNNPKGIPEWRRIEEGLVFDSKNLSFGEDSIPTLNQFTKELRNRYLHNYLEPYRSNTIETELLDFDQYWSEEE